MSPFNRRVFLKSSIATSAAIGIGKPLLFANSLSPSDTLRVAVLGTGGRGRDLIKQILRVRNVRLVALCDPDQARIEATAKDLQKSTDGNEKSNHKVELFNDYRHVLEKQDIDAVIIATPNHWHSLLGIHACQHGKHVYVEKPVCHTIWEGRKLIEAMRRYNRIVAAGFQNRSDVGLKQAIPRLHAGELGAIKKARGLCYRDRNSIGKHDVPLRPPTSLNYDLWLGPSQDIPIMRPKLHYDWHWDFNTGNGDMGNQGPHEMDLLRWVLGDPAHPQRVKSFGGRFGWNDAGDTPNMQCASFDFGNNVPVLFEVRNLYQKEKEHKSLGRYEKGPGVGIVITCEGGEFRGGRGGGAFFDNNGAKIEQFPGDDGRSHMQNFVDAVLAGDSNLLNAPLESSFYSSCLSHLANISVRIGSPRSVKDLKSSIQASQDSLEVYERFSRQLEHWRVDTNKTPWTIGPDLSFDSAVERFIESEYAQAANQLLHRNDREEFKVPDSV